MERDDQTRAVLARLAESNRLTCGDSAFDIWRDFDTEETRIRTKSGTAPIRIDEDALCDFVNEAGFEITDERIRELLCAIATQPDRYGRGIVVRKPL